MNALLLRTSTVAKNLFEVRIRWGLVLAAVSSGFMLIVGAPPSLAGSGTWALNPVNNDWNTAANWSSNTVPNGAFDTATFGVSNATQISLSADVLVLGIVFNPTSSTYTITCPAGEFSTLLNWGCYQRNPA